MSYSCKILLDSISETGKRLTTFEITFPRIVLAEFNTHRMFSRNSASSRAIPFKRQVERVLENPFIPERFPINGKGMQPSSYIYGNSDVYVRATKQWLHARDSAVNEAEMLYGLDEFADVGHIGVNIHKQIVNRLLEPFLWHTCIVTATEFDNFFKLRCDENAQYEIRRIADLMYEAYHAFDNEKWNSVVSHSKPGDLTINGILDDGWTAVKPQKLKIGEWHCPLIFEEDGPLVLRFISDNINNLKKEFQFINDGTKAMIEIVKKISVARCARVSYLTHDGKRDIEKDLELFERLKTSGHWSPFEHVATPYFEQLDREMSMYDCNDPEIKCYPTDDDKEIEIVYWNKRSGNFIGWKQFRKEFADENCANFRKESQ